LKGGTRTLEQCLSARRSCRDFHGGSLALNDVGQLLWAMQGVTGLGGLRTAPSAGCMFPLKIYLAAFRVDPLPTAVYRYDVDQHLLQPIKRGDQREALRNAASDQTCFEDAALVAVVTAWAGRARREFGNRGDRLIAMEAGHAGQNFLLQAPALGVSALGLGNFDDSQVRDAVSAPADEDPLYLLIAGH
jgi:SagB-type dehydrogenase family enzyme